MEIDFKEFKRLDIRVGLIKSCEKVPKSKRLYKLLVDCGEAELRQIITGIAEYYTIDELVNEKIVILANIKSRRIMGMQSNGMLLAADLNNEPFLLKIDEKKLIPPGTKIK